LPLFVALVWARVSYIAPGGPGRLAFQGLILANGLSYLGWAFQAMVKTSASTHGCGLPDNGVEPALLRLRPAAAMLVSLAWWVCCCVSITRSVQLAIGG